MTLRLPFGLRSLSVVLLGVVIILFNSFPLVKPETENQLPFAEQSPNLKTPGVALILGVGENVGKALALKLYVEGFKVAVASRSQSDPTEGKALPLKVDVTKEEDIVSAFKQVEKIFSAPPNVVIYNVALLSPPPAADDPFSLPYAKYLKDIESGAGGAYVAIQQAVTAWDGLPADIPKVFLATSNIHGVTPAAPNPMLLSLASQKRLLAYLIEAASITKLYRARNYRFYLPSQVGPNGGPPGDEFSGEPHATAYWNLIQQKDQGRWDVRFIKDGSVYKGY